MKSVRPFLILAAIAAVVAAAVLLLLDRTTGYAHGVTAIDGGQGLVTIWSNDGDTARQWLALTDADGTERWRVETTPAAPPVVEFAVATADAERVYLIEEDAMGEQTLDIVARRRSDGTVLWRTALTHDEPASASRSMSTPLRLAGGRLHFAYRFDPSGAGRMGREALIALDAATGGILWRAADEGSAALSVKGHTIVGEHLLFPGARPTWRSAASGAIVQRSPVQHLSCWTGEVLIVQDLDAGTLLVQKSPAVSAETFANAPTIEGAPPGTSLGLSSCGNFRKNLVLTFAIDGEGSRGLLLISLGADRQERWRLELPGHRLLAEAPTSSTPHIPMHGQLARFELVERLNAEREAVAIALVDLETGALAGQIETPTMTWASRVAGHHVLWIRGRGEADTIAVVDGATGAMLGARRYATGPSGFDASQVQGDVLWINAFGVRGPLDETSWLTLRLQDGLPIIHQNGAVEAPPTPLAIVR